MFLISARLDALRLGLIDQALFSTAHVNEAAFETHGCSFILRDSLFFVPSSATYSESELLSLYSGFVETVDFESETVPELYQL